MTNDSIPESGDGEIPVFEGCVVPFPESAEAVTDADEEIFILYSLLQNYDSSATVSEGFRGLGFLSSHHDSLDITFDLPTSTLKPSAENQSESHHKKHKYKKRLLKSSDPRQIVIQLAQDKTALRSRKGDTGSVVWRASVDFARLVVEQLYGHCSPSLFHSDRLREAHILELGAGTGLLSLVLSPHVKQYTVTDLDVLVPLIQKNIRLNSGGDNIIPSALDWVVLQNAPEHIRCKSFQYYNIDCLLVVDCIYHPALIDPLVETIDYLNIPGKTVTLIAMELRAEDVTRKFLQSLLDRPGWKLFRLPFLGLPYVLWGGFKI